MPCVYDNYVAEAMFQDLGSKTDDARLEQIPKALGPERHLSGYDPKWCQEYSCGIPKIARHEAIREVFAKLTYREKEMVSVHLRICAECLNEAYIGADHILHLLPRKTFSDIAADHMLSSPGTAERIYKEAFSEDA